MWRCRVFTWLSLMQICYCVRFNAELGVTASSYCCQLSVGVLNESNEHIAPTFRCIVSVLKCVWVTRRQKVDRPALIWSAPFSAAAINNRHWFPLRVCAAPFHSSHSWVCCGLEALIILKVLTTSIKSLCRTNPPSLPSLPSLTPSPPAAAAAHLDEMKSDKHMVRYAEMGGWKDARWEILSYFPHHCVETFAFSSLCRE